MSEPGMEGGREAKERVLFFIRNRWEKRHGSQKGVEVLLVMSRLNFSRILYDFTLNFKTTNNRFTLEKGSGEIRKKRKKMTIGLADLQFNKIRHSLFEAP